MKGHKSFIFAAYKQQYLEYIEHQDLQKAFTHLTKRLKPLEYLQGTPTEFRDLSYLLTAKSVQDIAIFKTWEGASASRDKLVETFVSMMDYDAFEREGSVYVPPKRLLTLLRQAVAYQVESSRYHSNITPEINTILHDYSPCIVPNKVKNVFKGHTENVKCVEFIGVDGKEIASGSRWFSI